MQRKRGKRHREDEGGRQRRARDLALELAKKKIIWFRYREISMGQSENASPENIVSKQGYNRGQRRRFRSA